MLFEELVVGMTLQIKKDLSLGNAVVLEIDYQNKIFEIKWDKTGIINRYRKTIDDFSPVLSHNKPVAPLKLPDMQKNVIIDHSDYKFFAKVHTGCCACGIPKSSCSYHS